MSCPDSPSSKRVIRWLLGLGLLAASGAGTAQFAYDLVSHNGFEACWQKAVTKTQFLGLLKSAIDGQTTCLLYISYDDSGFNWQMCPNPACPGGVGGCPVTLHTGAFNGDFATGQFSGSGTADDISVDMFYSGDVGGTCTLNFTNLTQTYSPFFYVEPDGNSGDHMYGLDPLTPTWDTHSSSSADPNCAAQASNVFFQVREAVRVQAQVGLYYGAVDQSVCPLTP